MDALEIQNICVRNGALDLEVGMAIDTLHVTEEQASRILELLPNLANHVCVNGAGVGSFGDEIVGTELAHLLEHVIIELQGKAAPEDRQLAGHTSWLEELDVTAPQGYALMRTTVSFANDFVALGAMNCAIEIVAWAFEPDADDMPDVDGMIAFLAAM